MGSIPPDNAREPKFFDNKSFPLHNFEFKSFMECSDPKKKIPCLI